MKTNPIYSGTSAKGSAVFSPPPRPTRQEVNVSSEKVLVAFACLAIGALVIWFSTWFDRLTDHDSPTPAPDEEEK